MKKHKCKFETPMTRVFKNGKTRTRLVCKCGKTVKPLCTYIKIGDYMNYEIVD